MNDNMNDNIEKETFLLCFSASIWKRIWRTAYLYAELKNISCNSAILIKSMKYNLFCRSGLLYQLLPLLHTAINQGFLMPKEYEKNEYAKRAIKIFGESYRLCKHNEQACIIDRDKQINKFLHEFASTICSDPLEYRNQEKTDILASFKNKENFIETIDSWDIDISLFILSNEIDKNILRIFNIILSSLRK
jgi:hypothetical protein